MDDLISAARAMLDNIDHWLETGEAATPEESKALVERFRRAVLNAEGKAQ